MSEAQRGSAAAALAACLFGTSYVATGFLLRSFTPVSGAFWRAILAAGILALMVFVSTSAHRADSLPPTRARVIRAILIGLCGGPLFLAGMNIAVAGVGASVTSFVTGLYSVLAAVFAPLVLSEPLRRRALAGFVVALVGSGLLAELNPDARAANGLLFAFLAAAVYAGYLLLGRRWSTQYGLSPVTLTVSTVGSTIPALLVWLLVFSPAELAPVDLRPDALIALAWLALVLAFGQTLVIAAVRRINAARSAAFLLLNPVTAAALGALLLGERLSALQLVGALLVLIGMAISIGLHELIGATRLTARQRPST